MDIKAAGLNSLRIPLGYWAVDLLDYEPYVSGQVGLVLILRLLHSNHHGGPCLASPNGDLPLTPSSRFCQSGTAVPSYSLPLLFFYGEASSPLLSLD